MSDIRGGKNQSFPGEPGTRNKILSAAKSLFAQSGFDGVSIKDIGKAAGTNSALISYYFGGKEKLFIELIRNGLPIGKLGSVDLNTIEALPALLLLVTEFMASQESEPEIFAIIHQEVSLRTTRSLVIQEILTPFWLALKSQLAKGKRSGVFTYESEDTAFRCTVGALLFRKHDWLLTPVSEKSETSESLARHVLEYILGGIGYRGNFDF